MVVCAASTTIDLPFVMTMKRFVTLILILLVVASPVLRAQMSISRNNLAVGAGGGANFSFVDFSPRIKQAFPWQPGMNGGVVVRYTSEKYFSMICAAQLEVNYTQRGWKEFIDDGSENTYSRTTSYIEVPFFAHLGWGKEQRGVQFFFNAGPVVGWYLSSGEAYGYSDEHPWNPSSRPNRVFYQYGDWGYDSEGYLTRYRPDGSLYGAFDPEQPGKPIENAFEYGIGAGLGVELKTALGNFTVEGRFFYGLSDMFGNSKADDFGRSANQTISLKLAWLVDVFDK